MASASASLTLQSTVALRNGARMPLLGLGTWKAEVGGECKRAVLEALKLGYRLIDTAGTEG